MKISVCSWGLGIWVSSTNFQKSNIAWPQQPPTEKVPNISEKLDFWWSIPQKGTIIGHFGATNDPTIRISKFFDEMRLSRSLRPMRLLRLLRPLRSLRLQRFKGLENHYRGLESHPDIKVIHTKYSKHHPYTVAHTIECVCSKINHGLNHGLFISLLKLINCPIHWIVYE